jgi:hypothetical protein
MFHVSRALFLPSFLETKQKPDVAGSPAHLSFISLVLSHMLAFLSLSHFTLFFLRLPRPLLPFSILITKAKDRKKKEEEKATYSMISHLAHYSQQQQKKPTSL